MTNKVLLHCCCAPCSVSCIEPLRLERIEPVAFWYNPNIHPWKEYEARRNCLISYAESINLKTEIKEEYGLKEFVCTVSENIANRCKYCYTHRIEKTAEYAANHGYTHFTTTLLASIYQNHNLITEACKEYATKYGVEFLYRDFRPNFRQGNNKARELGLYMQKYCGCIFSEEDRYLKQIKKSKEYFESL